MTSRTYGARSPRSHYDVTLIVTSFATELATPTVTYVRTFVRTPSLPRLIYKDAQVATRSPSTEESSHPVRSRPEYVTVCVLDLTFYASGF